MLEFVSFVARTTSVVLVLLQFSPARASAQSEDFFDPPPVTLQAPIVSPYVGHRAELVAELAHLEAAKAALRARNPFGGPLVLVGVGGAMMVVGGFFRFVQLAGEGSWNGRDENLARAAFFGGIVPLVGGFVWMTRRHHRRAVHDASIRALRRRIRDLDRSRPYGPFELGLAIGPSTLTMHGRF